VRGNVSDDVFSGVWEKNPSKGSIEEYGQKASNALKLFKATAQKSFWDCNGKQLSTCPQSQLTGHFSKSTI